MINGNTTMPLNLSDGAISNELIIDVKSSEIAIAHLKDKHLVELSRERSNIQYSVGDIYLGKIKKIIPGLNAAFVDIGHEKDAFLHYLDLGPQILTTCKYLEAAILRKGKAIAMQRFTPESDIDKKGKFGDVLQAGQLILVQIAKEPISTKGPRLCSEISIAGRNLVLMPFSEKVSISQRIASAEERKRLRALIHSIRPSQYGVIVRTIAENRSAEVLEEELNELVKKWENAFLGLKEAKAPKLFLSEINRTSTILRDVLNGSFSHIYVNDIDYYAQIKDYITSIAPGSENILKYIKGGTPIFERFGINKQIKALFGRTISIRNGAYIIIEHTEALHVIDVNSGNRVKLGGDQETNALEINLLAAQHIALQLRLRDMGGIIVIDFIDMYRPDHRLKVLEMMREAMADDRARHNILAISKFGLMQITRQRVRPELNERSTERCPICRGSGNIGASILFDDELFAKLTCFVKQGNLRSIELHVHPYIAAYLKKGIFSVRWKWVRKLRCYIKINSDSSLSFLESRFYDKNGEEITDISFLQ